MDDNVVPMSVMGLTHCVDDRGLVVESSSGQLDTNVLS